MTVEHYYFLVQIEPEALWGKAVTIGIALKKATGPDVRLRFDPSRLRALSPELRRTEPKAYAQQVNLALEQMPSVEARWIWLRTAMAPLRIGELEGTIFARDPEDLERQIDQILQRIAVTPLRADVQERPMPAEERSPAPVIDFDIEHFVEAAQRHGEDSDPDHEVGDLQDLLRAAWELMDSSQRAQFVRSDAASAVVESVLFEPLLQKCDEGELDELDEEEVAAVCDDMRSRGTPVTTNEQLLDAVNARRLAQFEPDAKRKAWRERGRP